MKTNLGLVDHCIRMLNERCRYFLGTYCNKFTETLMEQKFKQLPKYELVWGAYIRQNIDKYKDKRVTDCGGLIKGYLWWDDTINDPKYTLGTDKDVDTMYTQAVKSGAINTIPEVPGIIVRYPGHAGVYIGNGEVIEARGTVDGVVVTKLLYRPWTHWFEYKELSYITDSVGYSDVNKNHWAYYDIIEATKLGLLGGYPDGSFKSEQSPTRAEWAAIIMRFVRYTDKKLKGE